MTFDEILASVAKQPVNKNSFFLVCTLLKNRKWTKLRKLIGMNRVFKNSVWSRGFDLLQKVGEHNDPILIAIVVQFFFELANVIKVNNKFLLLQISLYFAIVIRHRVLIDLLIEVGACVNGPLDNETPLVAAIRTRAGLDIIRSLIDHGACVKGEGNIFATPLAVMIRYHINDQDVAELLFSRGADVYTIYPGSMRRTLVHLACEKNNNEGLRWLLSHNADANIQAECGETGLHVAARFGYVSCVVTLLECGASPNILNKRKETSLYVAVEANNVEITELYHAVAQSSPVEVVAELLNFGADVNLMSSCHSESPLHKACRLGTVDIVATLLDHGADISAVDCKGNTPFMKVKKTSLAMKIVAQGNWYVYENGKDVAGPSTPLYHLQRHAYKMSLLGLPLHPCFNPVLELEYSKNFISSCKKEIETMKISKIGTGYLCVYDIIKQKQDPAYVTKIEVLLNLHSNDRWENFTLFRGILKNCIKEAKLRNKYLDSGQKCVSDLLNFGCLNYLPNEVIRKIISYLRDEELLCLHSCKEI